MPKIVLKDGSEFIVDQDILDENILSAKPDEMIQLGKTFFKKSSIEIIHSEDTHVEKTITPKSKDKGHVVTSPQRKKSKPKYIISSQNKRIGTWFIFAPTLTLLLIFIVFIISNAVLAFLFEEGINTTVFYTPIRWSLGFLGLLNFVSILPLAILGFALRHKKELAPGEDYDIRSGSQEGEIPDEIRDWNWGAAAFTGYWLAYYSSWKSLLIIPLMIIPYVNIIVAIIFGMSGNQWAWQSKKWANVEEFNNAQRKSSFWAILTFILLFIYSGILSF